VRDPKKTAFMRPTTRRQTCEGVTLLELLVVITIAVILSMLAMSVLQNVRSRGDAAQCVNNLRVLAEANIRYSTDNEGRFCFAMDKSNRIRWHGARITVETPFDATKGPLAPYLGREGRVKVCPSFQQMLEGTYSFEEGAGGYGYNAVYIGGTPSNRWESELISNVENPALTVMFADTAFALKDGLQEYPFAEPWRTITLRGKLTDSLQPSVHFRHQGFANVAWCDGHVSAEKPTSLVGPNFYGGDNKKHKVGWFGPREENGYWNPRRTTRD
jgi:prepilin-type processing-associated H-X9-DG protein/prepilin-type N-terminal cleavage/methylation domain-containing protein